jgi:hypothetical protein
MSEWVRDVVYLVEGDEEPVSDELDVLAYGFMPPRYPVMRTPHVSQEAQVGAAQDRVCQVCW